MRQWAYNSGQYRDQSRNYPSPDENTPGSNMSTPDSQPQMGGFNGYSYTYPTNMAGSSGSPQVSQPYPPALNPPTAGPSVMQSQQQSRSHLAYQGSSGIARTGQQALERAPPQPPNLQTNTSPTDFWNPTITAQMLPTDVWSVQPRTSDSANTPTPGFGVEDLMPGPTLYTMPSEVPQGINLSDFYDDVVHPSYRNIRLRCLLKDPKGCQRNSKVVVRREKRVVLEIHLQADGVRIRDMGWKGIALPRTGSVKQSNQQPPARLLYFSIEVHGSTTGVILNQPCDNCWRREMRPLGNPLGLQKYLIDFKSDSPSTLFPRADNLPYIKAEVTFHFTCYSNHQKEDYELVAKLNDEQGNLVAYCQIPYSFKSVAKPDRDGGMQDDYPSAIPPVVSPVAATMPPAAGPSASLQTTGSHRRATTSTSQRPALESTSVRRPVPSSQLPPQWERAETQSSFGFASRTDILQPEAGDSPLLQKVSPIEGPTRGGLSVVLIGMNFPPWPTAVYARFGTAVAATSWINPFTLECILPTSPSSGVVDVTLSLSPDQNAPKLGQSLCTFTYRDEQESFLLMLRSIYSQGHELSRVALDILIPQILQHANPDSLSQALRCMAQSQDGLRPINERQLEDLGVRFLESISDSSDSQYWRNELSVADENHQTIAHLCVLSGYTRLLTMVVDWGIDLDVQDVSGLTALHCAYLREDWDCVRILKEGGAHESIEDDLGRVPRVMCRHVESESTTYSERETTSTSARFSSAGEEDWVDVSSRVSTSPENFTRPIARLPWRSPSDIKAVRASPMPILGPSSEDSSSADDEPWSTEFSNLHISDSPPRITRPLSSVTSSSSRRGGRATSYGWSHQTHRPSPPGVQRNVSSGASARFQPPPPPLSFTQMPTFPMPQPAVLSFPVPEPTGYLEDPPSRSPSSQPGSPNPVSSPISRYHTPAQAQPLRGPHATRSNVLAVSAPSRTSPSPQRAHQSSPSASSTRYVPPPGPPPRSVSSTGVTPSSQPNLSQYEKDEKAAIRRHLQEAARKAWPSAEQEKEKQSRTAWPSADQEKEKQSMMFKAEQKTATLENGPSADPKALVKAAMDRFQRPKQGEA